MHVETARSSDWVWNTIGDLAACIRRGANAAIRFELSLAGHQRVAFDLSACCAPILIRLSRRSLSLVHKLFAFLLVLPLDFREFVPAPGLAQEADAASRAS